MLAWGIAGDVIEIGALLLWIIKGIWIPFAIGMPIVIVMMVLVTRMYYRDTAYLCPTCHEIFRPSWKQFLFSAHTPRTRKLTCPACGTTGFCIETAVEKKEEEVE